MKCITTGINHIIPGLSAQVIKVFALPTFGCGIIMRDPDKVVFSPVYAMLGNVH
jgi:hypothetical protein